MNRELVVEPRERLLEVLLEEALRSASIAALTAVQDAPSPSRRRSAWFAAALALVGIGVVVGSVVIRRQQSSSVVPAQDPRPASADPWLQNHIDVTSTAKWRELASQVHRVRLQLVRLRPDKSGLELIEGATAVLEQAQQVRNFVDAIPAAGPGVVGWNEWPPFDTWLAFELPDGRHVNAFLLGSMMILGLTKVEAIGDAFQKDVQALARQASSNLRVSLGAVESLDALEGVPATTKAIRCPAPPSGTLEKHLGRFKSLEHLEVVFSTTFTTNLGAGQPISIQLPENPTTLFEEMRALPKLRHLRVSAGMLNSDASADELARLPRLESLRIDGSLLVDAGVLGGKIGVKGGITASGMRVLARKIEALELVDCDLTPVLLEPWLEAAQLRKLVLFGDAMPPELLARFARLPTLTELSLGGVEWSDAHLDALAGSKLTRLRLEHTKVTGAALLRLPTSLRTLDLRRQMSIESPYRGLDVALPECRVLRAGDVDATDPPLSDVPGATRR